MLMHAGAVMTGAAVTIGMQQWCLLLPLQPRQRCVAASRLLPSGDPGARHDRYSGWSHLLERRIGTQEAKHAKRGWVRR